MKIVELNAVPYGATGRIARQITDFANSNGYEAIFAYSWTKDVKYNAGENEIIATSFSSRLLHIVKANLFGGDGLYSQHSTRKFINKLRTIEPDIIHLHIMHSFFLNLPLLFDYIKEEGIKVVWTFQDCWALSGQCPHFVSVDCNKWKTGCYNCPFQKKYSFFPIDSAKKTWNNMKKCIDGVDSITIVPSANWVADFVRQSSIYSKCKVKVINNGIDLNVFKPTDSNFRKKYKIENKIIVLGVAFMWLYRKGLDVFQYLAEKLPEEYAIVMVGTDDSVDKQLSQRIISIHRTKNQTELAEIYTAADMFINPTREDTYPTVNMEALACGTPVITFRTGGSPESIDESCGSVVECGDIEGMYSEIIRVGSQKPFSGESCLRKASDFDLYKKYAEYLKLFDEISAQ